MACDPVQIGIRELQDLMQPVRQLDVGIAPHPAEHGRALDRAVGELVQLAEECRPADLAHVALSRAVSMIMPSALRVRRIAVIGSRSEEHTSELQSLIRISYAVFCLKKKNT